MRQAKLKQVLSAVDQLHNSRGVTQTDVQDFLRDTYGCGISLDCKLALKAAVNEGYLAVKNRRFFPTTNTVANTFLEMRRKRRKRTKRTSRSRPRRRQSRHSASTDNTVMARRRGRHSKSVTQRKRRRGRKHDAFGDDVDARRRKRRSTRRKRGGKSKSSTGRKRRRGRKHDEGVEKGINEDSMQQNAEEPVVKQGEDEAQ